MSFSIEFADEARAYNAKIKVIGVGGSGGNAINTMIHFGLEGVEFITVNTDAQALGSNSAAEKISIGANVSQVVDVVFRLPPRYATPWQVSLLVIVGLIVLSISVLERRVRGVEVVT